MLHLRGTGLNNHNSSFIKLDNDVLFDHAFYMGLYMVILDRRDLSLTYSGFFNTSIPGSTVIRSSTTTIPTIEDFQISNAMAKIIKQYKYTHFVIIVSQY